MLLLGWGSGYNRLWPIFGSANQLLGALALLIGSCWLALRGRNVWYTLLPACFMLVTSVWMLLRLLYGYFHQKIDNPALLVTEVLVLAMTMGIVALTARRWYALRTHSQPTFV